MTAATLTTLFPWFAFAALALGAGAGILALAKGHRRAAATFVVTVSVLLGLFVLWLGQVANAIDGPAVLGLAVLLLAAVPAGAITLALGLVWLAKGAPTTIRRTAQLALFSTALFVVSIVYVNLANH